MEIIIMITNNTYEIIIDLNKDLCMIQERAKALNYHIN